MTKEDEARLAHHRSMGGGCNHDDKRALLRIIDESRAEAADWRQECEFFQRDLEHLRVDMRELQAELAGAHTKLDEARAETARLAALLEHSATHKALAALAEENGALRAHVDQLKLAGDVLCSLHLQDCPDEPCRWARVWREAKAHYVSNTPKTPTPT